MGGILYQSRTRQRLAATVAVVFALGCVRVANLPPSATTMPDYTWGTALTEVRHDIEATVIGIRQARADVRASLSRMSADTQLLRERLTVSSITTSAAR